jgi:hypothetical protein
MSRRVVPGTGRWYGFALLIVDDNVGFRDDLRALVEEHGISVVGGVRRSAKSVTAWRCRSRTPRATRGTIHRSNAVALSRSSFRIGTAQPA